MATGGHATERTTRYDCPMLTPPVTSLWAKGAPRSAGLELVKVRNLTPEEARRAREAAMAAEHACGFVEFRAPW